mgnify:CR=1 FL=1
MTNAEARVMLYAATRRLRKFSEIVESMEFGTIDTDKEEAIRELLDEIDEFLAVVAPGLPQELSVAEILLQAGPPDQHGFRTITVGTKCHDDPLLPPGEEP